MKLSQALTGILAAVVVSHSAAAQGFATGSSPWSRPLVNRYSADYQSPGLDRGNQYSARNASYWVERDPRYVPSLPKVARTTYQSGSYRNDDARYSTGYRGGAYDGAYQSQYGPGGCATARNYNGIPVGNALGYGSYPSRSPLPKNYYKGDGLFGKDTVFAKDQPVRNFFRYLMP